MCEQDLPGNAAAFGGSIEFVNNNDDAEQRKRRALRERKKKKNVLDR